MEYFEDKVYENLDFSVQPFSPGEYQYCRFINCDLSNVSLIDCVFVECYFENCNLSMADLSNTAFRDVKFHNCKMLGLRFENCNDFGLAFTFDNCSLDNSTFYKLKIPKTHFRNCKLQDVDFMEAELTESSFHNCDLSAAAFDHSNLEKCDFRTAYNFSIDPENNRIKKAKFSSSALAGLLGKYNLDIDFNS